jgi:Concanavalin A-like lectin/glucanases superfamily/MBG domain
MSKKKDRAPKKSNVPQRKNGSRRRIVAVAGLLLSLGLTGIILAQWKAAKVSTNVAAPAPLTPLQQANQTPTLAKEYIYAGGRLVAIEEPQPTILEQSITFDSISDKTFNDAPFNLNATASSSLPVSFTITSGPATVSGNTVTITGAGSVTIRADQAGNVGFHPAPPVTQSFTVAKAAATINLSNLSQTFDGSAHYASAVTTPANLTVNLSYSQSGSAVASPTNAGSYEVTATVNDSNYQGTATCTLVIAKSSQSVTFDPLPNKTFGDPAFGLSASSTSGLPVSFALMSGPVTLSGNTLTLTGAGTVTVRASQAGNSNYAAATDIDRSFTVAKATATITLGSLEHTYDGAPKSATAMTNPVGLSGVAITYNGSATAPTNAGSYSVVASLTNDNYTASNATGTLVISKATPSIFWSSPADITYGTALGSTQLNATASFGGNSLSGTFSYTPGAGTILGAGSNQLLSTIFTPSDTSNFNAAPASARINVLPVAAYSLSGNGMSDYMEVLNSASINITGAFTAEAWVKLNNSTGAYQCIFERFGPSGIDGGFILRIAPNGKLEFYVLQSGQVGYPITGNTVVSSNVWHHVAAVDDGTQLRIYLDGVLDASLSVSAYPATGTTNLFIGSGNWGGGRINGKIDEARLTAASLYSSNFTPEVNLTAEANTRGLWKFDGSSAKDFSGNGNTGMLKGAPTYSADLPALINRSVSFNTSSLIRVPDSSGINVTGPITVETWFKLNSISGQQQLISRNTAGGAYFLISNDGMPQFYVRNGSGQSDFVIAWPPIITANEWHHMAGVFDGSQLRIYLNGVLCASKKTVIGPGSGNSELTLGGNKDGVSAMANGLMDEVRITGAALYTSNFTPSKHLMATPGTKGLWKFDGETLQDVSGNGNNGTFGGGASYSTTVP